MLVFLLFFSACDAPTETDDLRLVDIRIKNDTGKIIERLSISVFDTEATDTYRDRIHISFTDIEAGGRTRYVRTGLNQQYDSLGITLETPDGPQRVIPLNKLDFSRGRYTYSIWPKQFRTIDMRLVRDSPALEDSTVEVRVRNKSVYDFESVAVRYPVEGPTSNSKNVDYGYVERAAKSAYKKVPAVYGIAPMTVIADTGGPVTDTLHSVPIDLVGEGPHGSGRFTYNLSLPVVTTLFALTSRKETSL